jgi:hypothetical protein
MASTTTNNTSTPAASDRPAAAMAEPGNPGAAAGAGGGAAPSSVPVAATTRCAFCAAGEEDNCLAPDNKCTTTPAVKTRCCEGFADWLLARLRKLYPEISVEDHCDEVVRFYNPQPGWHRPCPCVSCCEAADDEDRERYAEEDEAAALEFEEEMLDNRIRENADYWQHVDRMTRPTNSSVAISLRTASNPNAGTW